MEKTDSRSNITRLDAGCLHYPMTEKFRSAFPIGSKLREGHAIPRTRTKTPEESHNEQFVNSLYEAIATENTEVLTTLLAPELEWWYHGPPSHQHMKNLLTGETSCGAFAFTVTKLGLLSNKVFVEGCGRNDRGSWVHVWTIADGKVTELREYYNTSVMVVNGGLLSSDSTASSSQPRPPLPRSGASWSSSSSLSANERVRSGATTLWQNSIAALHNVSIPGIVFYTESFRA